MTVQIMTIKDIVALGCIVKKGDRYLRCENLYLLPAYRPSSGKDVLVTVCLSEDKHGASCQRKMIEDELISQYNPEAILKEPIEVILGNRIDEYIDTIVDSMLMGYEEGRKFAEFTVNKFEDEEEFVKTFIEILEERIKNYNYRNIEELSEYMGIPVEGIKEYIRQTLLHSIKTALNMQYGFIDEDEGDE